MGTFNAVGSHELDALMKAGLIKGGSLDEPPDLTGGKHIWTKRKLAGIQIPDGCETWPEEPSV